MGTQAIYWQKLGGIRGYQKSVFCGGLPAEASSGSGHFSCNDGLFRLWIVSRSGTAAAAPTAVRGALWRVAGLPPAAEPVGVWLATPPPAMQPGGVRLSTRSRPQRRLGVRLAHPTLLAADDDDDDDAEPVARANPVPVPAAPSAPATPAPLPSAVAGTGPPAARRARWTTRWRPQGLPVRGVPPQAVTAARA